MTTAITTMTTYTSTGNPLIGALSIQRRSIGHVGIIHRLHIGYGHGERWEFLVLVCPLILVCNFERGLQLA